MINLPASKRILACLRATHRQAQRRRERREKKRRYLTTNLTNLHESIKDIAVHAIILLFMKALKTESLVFWLVLLVPPCGDCHFFNLKSVDGYYKMRRKRFSHKERKGAQRRKRENGHLISLIFANFLLHYFNAVVFSYARKLQYENSAIRLHFL